MLAPAVPDVMRSLGSDNAELESFVVSIYVIGYALGPLIAAPMSEIYGRSIVITCRTCSSSVRQLDAH